MDKAQNDHPKRTIVGGRPRKRGLGRAGIPRGIEVLIKKASLDAAFCRLLLEQRAQAAGEIELELTPAETGILNSVPQAQLQAMVDHTRVPDTQRRAFLGQLGAAMLAAVTASCTPPTTIVEGIRPEATDTRTPVVEVIRPEETVTATYTPIEISKGIRPEDLTRWAERTASPESTSTPKVTSNSTPAGSDSQPPLEMQPTPPAVRGIRPDRP